MSRKCWWCGRHCASVGTAPLKRQKRVINHPLNTIKCRNPILMTCHYPDTGGTSVWACRDGNLFTTNPPKICFNQYHQYGISALILMTSLCGEPVLALLAIFSQDLLHCFSVWTYHVIRAIDGSPSGTSNWGRWHNTSRNSGLDRCTVIWGLWCIVVAARYWLTSSTRPVLLL